MSNPDTTAAAEREADAMLMARLSRLEAALNQAYTILCSGNPPWSAREANARNRLRDAGARISR